MNNLNKNNQTPVIGEINTSFEAHTDEDTFENINVMLDPRSPSVDFTRTPIVTEKSGVKLRNKNLDKVKKLTIEYSPVKKAQNEVDRKSKGPILLESSPIVKKLEESERPKSYIGLLETNLDFIETDLDQVSKNIKDDLKIVDKNVEEMPVVPEERSFGENSEVKPSKVFEPLTEIQPVQSEVKCTEVLESITVIQKVIEEKVFEDKEQKLSQIEEEIKEVIEVSVDPTIELDKSKIEVILEQEIRTPVKVQKCLESENPVLDFDKKISNLIYEDQSVQISSPKQNKLNNRTPLGDRNRITNSTSKTTASKLKVHDKPRNQYSVSKIPVFKEKKSNKNCENTPPNAKKPESKVKRSMWDTNDKTLII